MDNLNLISNSFKLEYGTVADNYDPENFGRVRVHIKGKTDDITNIEDLPFARVLHPLGSVLGRADNPPEIGTEIVMLMPNEKDYNSLIILGCFKSKNQIVQ